MFNAAARRRFSTDFVILGGGLTGLAAATRLGRAAVVLEADARPGGLVRTERFGEYWFDRVSHLLFFPNEEVEADVRGRVGDVLAPCPPSAWVTTHSGVARFPLQHHLGHLRADVVERCLRDFRLGEKTPLPKGKWTGAAKALYTAKYNPHEQGLRAVETPEGARVSTSRFGRFMTGCR